MRIFKYLFAASFLLTLACTPEVETTQKKVVVKVFEQELTLEQLNAAMPRGLSVADSTLFADNYVREWVRSQLLFDVAQRNVVRPEFIQKQVETYRRSLIINDYLQRMQQERASSEVTLEQMQHFYEQHKNDFILEEPIIQGFYIKIPANAPKLEEMQKSLKTIDEQTLEEIEKYSLQNALVYEYFYDRWVPFTEVMYSIPYEVSDEKSFLKDKERISVTHDGFWYFLYIHAYELAGAIEPFDYAKQQIEKLILNDHKQQFTLQLETELYDEAIKENNIIYFDNALKDSLSLQSK